MGNESVRSVEPERLHALCTGGERVDLIDVRTPAEYRSRHADVAISVPLDRLNAADLMAGRNAADGPLYVICGTGQRGRTACDLFGAAGYENVINVAGGTDAWARAGLPVVRGKSTMSLERQVRISAGAMVFVGSLLAAFVSPYWLVLPGFVGAGLVFAGVTDTCGMGMLLAKMPWNRACGSSRGGH